MSRGLVVRKDPELASLDASGRLLIKTIEGLGTAGWKAKQALMSLRCNIPPIKCTTSRSSAIALSPDVVLRGGNSVPEALVIVRHTR